MKNIQEVWPQKKKKGNEMTFHKLNCLNTCDDILIELRCRERNYTVSEAATQLQCFKQIGSDQSHRLTIWGRMVVFQTRAICGTRTEEKLIVLVQSVWM